MNREFQYLQRIIKHSEEHIVGQQNLSEELSCIICYPEDQLLALVEHQEFAKFWRFVINTRFLESVFTQKTIFIFEELRKQIDSWITYRLIEQLVTSIRYKEVPT